ncbi:helix-turn-helix domain-containing protein [Hyalangium rubrum]|uniref:Helix-turn-helix transcriptional regulator n=1 Tax=Hyalangium rubrum TaxID=3103134 RepID=A0ABU5HCL0_9BACT|nr:helix-turn-helix transcriptional regulator [Hyalangium sp. s54d21]MDY7229840.1 helix-turn-helix transcriptional regulator [Hyalangium sp. s54d21]
MPRPRVERRRRPERAEQYESAAYRDLQRRLAVAVRHLRGEKGWTQEEAAHRCGMTTRLFQRVEGEEVNLTFTTLARLCEGFEVDVVHLLKALGGEKRRSQKPTAQ